MVEDCSRFWDAFHSQMKHVLIETKAEEQFLFSDICFYNYFGLSLQEEVQENNEQTGIC